MSIHPSNPKKDFIIRAMRPEVVFVMFAYKSLSEEVLDDVKKDFRKRTGVTEDLCKVSIYNFVDFEIERHRSQPMYAILVDNFLEELPLSLPTAQIEFKLQVLIIQNFYNAKTQEFSEESLWMVLVMVGDLVNTYLLHQNVTNAYALLTRACQLVQKLSPTFIQQIMQKVKFHLKATQPSSSITASPSRQQSFTEQSSSTNHIAPVTSGGLESKIATMSSGGDEKAMVPSTAHQRISRRRRQEALAFKSQFESAPSSPDTLHYKNGKKLIYSAMMMFSEAGEFLESQGLQNIGHSNMERRIGIVLHEYGNWIEMSEPYQKLIKALERRIFVHQDEDVLQEVIGQFVLPDKNVITYDQIMTMLLLVREIEFVDDTEETVLEMSYSVWYYVESCSKKLQNIVARGWEDLPHLADKLYKKRDKKTLSILGDPSFINGRKFPRTKQEAFLIFQSQEKPFILDPSLTGEDKVCLANIDVDKTNDIPAEQLVGRVFPELDENSFTMLVYEERVNIISETFGPWSLQYPTPDSETEFNPETSIAPPAMMSSPQSSDTLSLPSQSAHSESINIYLDDTVPIETTEVTVRTQPQDSFESQAKSRLGEATPAKATVAKERTPLQELLESQTTNNLRKTTIAETMVVKAYTQLKKLLESQAANLSADTETSMRTLGAPSLSATKRKLATSLLESSPKFKKSSSSQIGDRYLQTVDCNIDGKLKNLSASESENVSARDLRNVLGSDSDNVSQETLPQSYSSEEMPETHL